MSESSDEDDVSALRFWTGSIGVRRILMLHFDTRARLPQPKLRLIADERTAHAPWISASSRSFDVSDVLLALALLLTVLRPRLAPSVQLTKLLRCVQFPGLICKASVWLVIDCTTINSARQTESDWEDQLPRWALPHGTGLVGAGLRVAHAHKLMVWLCAESDGNLTEDEDLLARELAKEFIQRLQNSNMYGQHERVHSDYSKASSLMLSCFLYPKLSRIPLSYHHRMTEVMVTMCSVSHLYSRSLHAPSPNDIKTPRSAGPPPKNG